MQSPRNPIYLCYDLKGIQSFIFSIPKLKYICGGSAIVAQFDKEKVQNIKVPGAELLFSGGGKGAFRCESIQVADGLQKDLVELAHRDGLNICFGRNNDYSVAAHQANRSFPCLPNGDELNQPPCPVSGLLPSDKGMAPRIVQERVWRRGERRDRYFEEELLKGLDTHGETLEALEFFHAIGSEDDDARAGSMVMGDRNRWAVIAMDGNDLGRQHREAVDMFKGNMEGYADWLKDMSASLDACTRKACRVGIQSILDQWVEEEGEVGTLLPFRPLVVGGDDIVVLCHVRYAMHFVKSVCEAFEQTSETLSVEWAERHQGQQLWPATGGRLTISAGVLFAPVTLPLSSAIEFTESLLKSAKGKGRLMNRSNNKEPVPASVDWESITEGSIETPAARRQRELVFYDEDCGETIELSARPYTLDEMEDLEKRIGRYQNIPSTILHQILPQMQKAFWDRRVYVERLRKHHPILAKELCEGDKPSSPSVGDGWHCCKEGNRRVLGVLDAVFLLEEEIRMQKMTVEEAV